ncbi:S-adenosyl-L-methionine-dependent methyltransferase [Dichotomocladium elegans]|nr:S-adenosyl-L-methionine-dependent methyltransferase [Dichotomocladium elegans]
MGTKQSFLIEDDRLHLQHKALKLAFGTSFDAPIEQCLDEGTNVLDSACGPGSWTLEMAKRFPNSKFYGTDLSSRFPDQNKPDNTEFRVLNIVDESPFESNYFGYIHQRAVTLGIKIADWPKILENIKRTLKPGGWVELTEVNLINTTFRETRQNVSNQDEIGFKLMAAGGMDPDLGSKLTNMLSEAGFVNVQKRSFDVPINHGGELGEIFWYDFKRGLESSKLAYARVHPEFEEPGVYEKFLEDMGEESKINKTTIRWTRAFAQKPLESDD